MNTKRTTFRCAMTMFCGGVFLSSHLCIGDQSVNMNSRTIRYLIQSNDYKRLGAYVDGIGANWSENPEPGYFDALLTVSKEVAAYGAPSEERSKFLLVVAENALEKDTPKGIRRFELLDKQAGFLNVLMNEAVFAGTPNLREKRCRLLVTFLARINNTRDPAYVPVEEVATIPPVIVDGIKPGDIPLGAGMRPDAIKNEELRREYERRIRENEERAEHNQLKAVSNRIYSRLEGDVKMFFINLYKDDPEGLNSIRHWLEMGGFSKSFIDKVVTAVPPHGR